MTIMTIMCMVVPRTRAPSLAYPRARTTSCHMYGCAARARAPSRTPARVRRTVMCVEGCATTRAAMRPLLTRARVLPRRPRGTAPPPRGEAGRRVEQRCNPQRVELLEVPGLVTTGLHKD